MADGSLVPDYYSFDESTGMLILENYGFQLVDDEIVLVVSSTDGVQA